MNILIIDDDHELAGLISQGLEHAKHTSHAVFNGEDGKAAALSGNYDAIVCDRVLPDCDGVDIPASLRASNIATPVLLLSALRGVKHKVEGLKAGADDYLCKPFSFIELIARIENMGRRNAYNKINEQCLVVGELKLNRLDRVVSREKETIALQPREFGILEYLMLNADSVVTRTMLLEKIWDISFDPQTNVVEVHISRLRCKIDQNFDKKLIKTVRGSGYIISASE